MKRRRRKKHTPDQMEQQRRGRKVFRVLGRVLLTGIVLAAAVVAMTVFFRVKTISVEGAEQYGSEELIAGMDVQMGDNLYLWNKNRVLSDLMHSFPYLERAQLRRKLPDGLVLTVTECSAAAAVRNEDNTFTYISAGGKVLENNAADGGLPTVLGVTLNAQIGDFLDTGTDAHVDAMLNVLENMDAAGLLEKMSFLNLNDLTDVRIGYDKRFDIRAGSLDDLTYRLRFAQTVISDRLSASDIGRLYWDAQNRLHFVPETAEDVARSGTDQAGDNPVTSRRTPIRTVKSVRPTIRTAKSVRLTIRTAMTRPIRAATARTVRITRIIPMIRITRTIRPMTNPTMTAATMIRTTNRITMTAIMTTATMAKAEFFLLLLAKITENTGKNAKKYSFFPYRPPVCGKDTEKIKFF
ncbi:cell division protein FtsQ/DivIB [Agathobaculum butyriciproducens]|uniref:cell division protein FtsQ/DivIB n=1 Tax=Agathobaculum butyriciproducens TaxID=1628085 RepID=UPI0036D22EB2